ncbi:hypothetical protein HYH03_007994 [Edaphochlamys debaryana]|uniref:Mind bomb SH3 repeat domain-containing protein n=1 Tax=Edaphochlamys debaryana TaxID=47281 RepID=A0A835Y0R7_9CHLO|nr:hypothetical protein HYH03_007994 [Edaphochlamys debaryana]|eukprot:KAG2493773.1 hypothetical protein HYH03_007994 [Edaphochlamys debaryana]
MDEGSLAEALVALGLGTSRRSRRSRRFAAATALLAAAIRAADEEVEEEETSDEDEDEDELETSGGLPGHSRILEQVLSLRGQAEMQGAKVRIKRVDAKEAKKIGHGGWADEMAPMVGQAGVITEVDSDGDYRVRIGNKIKCWAPCLVEVLEPGFSKGAKVRIKAVTAPEARAAMESHGGWMDNMTSCLGKEGCVKSVDSDGDVHVHVYGSPPYCWNPALVEHVAPKQGDRVRVRGLTVAQARAAQERHGGRWSEGMARMLDGSFRVEIEGQPADPTDTTCWAPSLLEVMWSAEDEAGASKDERVGARVRIKSVPVSKARAALQGHGGWVEEMAELLGKEGEVVDVTLAGDHRIMVFGTKGCLLWPASLIDYPKPQVGDKVCIRKVAESKAKELQSRHGGWTAAMQSTLGKTGVVQRIDKGGGGARVLVDGSSEPFLYHPQMLLVLERGSQSQSFKLDPGNKVRVKCVSVEAAQVAQQGHGGWADPMELMLGKTGTIGAVLENGDCWVHIEGNLKRWAPTLLEDPRKPPFEAGDRVRVRGLTVAQARAAQERHGGRWSEGMAGMLGKAGVVEGYNKNRIYTVKLDAGGSWQVAAPLLAGATSSAAASTAPPAARARLAVGDRVRIKAVGVDELRAAQGILHGGCNPRMAEMQGKEGTVTCVFRDGDVKVKSDVGEYCFNGTLVEPASGGGGSSSGVGKHTGVWRDGKGAVWCSIPHMRDGPLCTHGPILQQSHWSCCGSTSRGENAYRGRTRAITVGDKVRIKAVSVGAAKAAQMGFHGGWNNEMAGMLGKEGTVTRAFGDGDYMVEGDVGEFCWNGSLVEAAGSPSGGARPGMEPLAWLFGSH